MKHRAIQGAFVVFRLTTILSFSFYISACANLGVEAWDRDLLAKPAMAINSAPLDQAIDDHIYFSKEASSGGKSFAGGGCGCN
ncbi:MAG: DUF4266 domain-containing protein [Enterobacterales bacterium]|nr:DUF4266 domain-containing protein [Enterobacterales bacterium]